MADAHALKSHVVTSHPDGMSHTEQPVRFRAGDDEVFGILTEPSGPPRGIGVVLLNATSDRNRFLTRFARRLAAAGFHVLRFDYHGFGESSGPLTGKELKHAMITLTTLQEPFTQDFLGGVEELRRRGLQHIVVIGRCFGSRTALSGVKDIPDLRGIVLISLPMHSGGDAQHPTNRWALDEVRSAAQRGAGLRVLRGMLNPRRRQRWMRKIRTAAGQLLRRPAAGKDGQPTDWVAETVVESLRDATSRHIPVMILFGREESTYRDFLQAQAGPLGFLKQATDRVTVSLVDGPTNNLTNLTVQEDVMRLTQEWVESRVRVS